MCVSTWPSRKATRERICLALSFSFHEDNTQIVPNYIALDCNEWFVTCEAFTFVFLLLRVTIFGHSSNQLTLFIYSILILKNSASVRTFKLSKLTTIINCCPKPRISYFIFVPGHYWLMRNCSLSIHMNLVRSRFDKSLEEVRAKSSITKPSFICYLLTLYLTGKVFVLEIFSFK